VRKRSFHKYRIFSLQSLLTGSIVGCYLWDIIINIDLNFVNSLINHLFYCSIQYLFDNIMFFCII